LKNTTATETRRSWHLVGWLGRNRWRKRETG
jgi:hypothetical protein